MQIIEVTEATLPDAGYVHAESWKASHRSFCSAAFVEKHTPAAQTEYLRREMDVGKNVYMLVDEHPVGIVSVHSSMIENLYVLPGEQRKGYGSLLLRYAIRQCEESAALWMLNTNTDARRLYERHGFRVTGNRKPLKKDMYEIEMRRESEPEPVRCGNATDIGGA